MGLQEFLQTGAVLCSCTLACYEHVRLVVAYQNSEALLYDVQICFFVCMVR